MQLIKKCSAFYGTRKFITVLTSARIRVGEYFTSGLFCLQRKHLGYEYFLTFVFSLEGVVSASSNPQDGGPPLFGCPRLLIQFIRSSPPYRRPFLHPQPQDAPCRGDRDPQTHIIYTLYIIYIYDVQCKTYIVKETLKFCELHRRTSSHLFCKLNLTRTVLLSV